jgi:virginiamycin B lyase
MAACAEPAPSGTDPLAADARATTSPPPATTPPPESMPGEAPEATPSPQPELAMEAFDVPAGSGPHDVAPAADGGVWYVAQAAGEAGWLDPADGSVRRIPLGPGSRPHGVIVGPDDAAWITDGGRNAIIRIDGSTDELTEFPLPADAPDGNLNTAAFDGDGVLWFTGQTGIIGRLDPAEGVVTVYPAPRGQGPYGIDATPDGEVWFASLAGSYLGAIDRTSGEVSVIDTPTPGGGARRVWADSEGALWVTEWNAGRIARYDPADGDWTEWDLPGDSPMPYAVYVDETDAVWVTDFGANALHRFDPRSETFATLLHESQPANVRQLLGRPGEVWGAESAADRLIVVSFGR